MDSNQAGQAQAWQYTASASGTSSSVVFYVDGSSRATTGQLGIYSDAGGSPGQRLGSATFTPHAGAWNTVALGGVSVTAGTKYWLVELGTSGSLNFRDRAPGASGCASQGSQQSNLTALPSTWSAGPNWSMSCPASFYVTSVSSGSGGGSGSATGSGSSLVGDTAQESNVDSNQAGQAQAWQYTASASGTSSSVVFYVDGSSRATTGQLGIYSDAGGSPGQRLGSATFTPHAGAWNTVALGGVSVTAGTKYWLVELGTSGSLNFRDRAPGASGCASQGSQQSNLTALPSTWSAGPNWSMSCPASFYVTGGGSQVVSPPADQSPPTISGTPQQGDALTASTGSWSNSPTSYGYQWQDCSSASSCLNISGATGSSYTLQSSDVGKTIDVVVTATNSGGSGHATSAQTSAVTAPASSGSLSPLHVSGNRLVDGAGQTVVLHGTDVSGSSYACEQSGGYGFSDTPTGDSLYGPMVSNAGGALPKNWTINSVTLLLNQDCWLGINGVNPAYSGQNYINYVKGEVASMEKHGIYPVLVFGEGAPGSQTPNWYATDAGEATMPDNDHMPLAWEELANTFKGDPNVIFRLYEEPFPNSSGTDLSTWKCWSQGDVQYGPSSVRTPPAAPVPVSSTSHCSENYGGTAYQTVGMQSLVNIIRGAGASNVIQVPGVAFANALSCSNTGSPTQCGFLDSADGVKVNDTLSSPQLMADTDNYPDEGQFCGTTTCLNDTYAPVAAVMPIDMGEVGTVTNSAAVAEQFVQWYDSHGQSYYGSQWETWSSFITNYNGTPGSGWGTWYYDHITSANY